jgi:hypothetical protein
VPWTRLQTWPPIDSQAALLTALQERMGYCTCASHDTLCFLRDFLRLVVERSNAIADQDTSRVRKVHGSIEEMLQNAGSPALQSWFVYSLEKADLVLHNYNRYDLLIADRGQWLMDGLERFPEPPTTDDAVGDQDRIGDGVAEFIGGARLLAGGHCLIARARHDGQLFDAELAG